MSELARHYLGQQVGHYRITRLLGQGGFADVYLGEHIYLKTQNAIKMLHVQLSERALQDFLHEATSSGLQIGIYTGSLTFRKGSSAWTVTVTYTIVQA